MVLQQAKEAKSGGLSIEEFAKAIRVTHQQGIEDQRKAGLKKLKAWRAFYAERHPELAAEYDDLVAKYCHEERWHPERYTDDDRVQSWVNPFQEDLHLSEDTLVEYQSRKVGMMAVCADATFVLSNHAATRMAQRSIRRASLELVLLHGTRVKAQHECEEYILSGRTVPHLTAAGCR